MWQNREGALYGCVICCCCLIKNGRLGARAAKKAGRKGRHIFYDLGIEFSELSERRLTVGGVKVVVKPQVLDGKVWLAECWYTLTAALATDASARNEKIQIRLRESFISKLGGEGKLYEEYTVVLVDDYRGRPERWVEGNKLALAKLLKSMNKPLDEEETKGVLASRVRYSAKEMTVVDWDGAVILAEDDFQSDIDLMKTGNY